MNMDVSQNWTAIIEWGAFLQQSCKLLRVLLCLECQRLWWVRERVVYGMARWEAQRELSGVYQLFRGSRQTREQERVHITSPSEAAAAPKSALKGRREKAEIELHCSKRSVDKQEKCVILYPGRAKTGGYILHTCRASVTVQFGTLSPTCSRAPLPLRLITGGSTVLGCLPSSLRNTSSSVKF